MQIVIVHHPSNIKWLSTLQASLRGAVYPISVVHNTVSAPPIMNGDSVQQIYNPAGGFEIGALRVALEVFPNEQDFFLIQDTCEVKDQKIFDICASHAGSVAICDGFLSYLGKYTREVLIHTGLPEIKSKFDSIMAETHWNRSYVQADKNFKYFAELIDDWSQLLVDNPRREVKHGFKCMILENDYIIKNKREYGQNDIRTLV